MELGHCPAPRTSRVPPAGCSIGFPLTSPPHGVEMATCWRFFVNPRHILEPLVARVEITKSPRMQPWYGTLCLVMPILLRHSFRTSLCCGILYSYVLTNPSVSPSFIQMQFSAGWDWVQVAAFIRHL